MTQGYFHQAFRLRAAFRWMVTALVSSVFVQSGFSQTVYSSDSSSVRFRSETILENIEAHNAASTSLIEMSSRTIQFQVPVSAFQFQNRMMQEHFNEGYLDPRKFPYATFRGKLADSLYLSIDTVYQVDATGMLNVHGIDRVGTYRGVMVCKDSVAELMIEFQILLTDHGVKIPAAVFDNIAKVVSVEVYFRYRPYRKEE